MPSGCSIISENCYSRGFKKGGRKRQLGVAPTVPIGDESDFLEEAGLDRFLLTPTLVLTLQFVSAKPLSEL